MAGHLGASLILDTLPLARQAVTRANGAHEDPPPPTARAPSHLFCRRPSALMPKAGGPRGAALHPETASTMQTSQGQTWSAGPSEADSRWPQGRCPFRDGHLLTSPQPPGQIPGHFLPRQSHTHSAPQGLGSSFLFMLHSTLWTSVVNRDEEPEAPTGRHCQGQRAVL